MKITHKWLRVFSPFVIVSVLFFAGMVYCLFTLKEHYDWKVFIAIVYSIAIVLLQVSDFLLKIWLALSTPEL